MDEWEATLSNERSAVESEMSQMAEPIISAAERS